MPTYCYRTKDGRLHELVMSIGEMERRQKPGGVIQLDDGRMAHRDYKAEFASTPEPSSCWPMASDAAGIHPSQIPEYKAEMKKHGVSAEFKSDGRMVFRDRAHRRQCLRALGMHDRNAGYSD